MYTVLFEEQLPSLSVFLSSLSASIHSLLYLWKRESKKRGNSNQAKRLFRSLLNHTISFPLTPPLSSLSSLLKPPSIPLSSIRDPAGYLLSLITLLGSLSLSLFPLNHTLSVCLAILPASWLPCPILWKKKNHAKWKTNVIHPSPYSLSFPLTRALSPLCLLRKK